MFPSSARSPNQLVPRSWREAAQNAADLVIAFMTLEGYGLDDLRLRRRSAPSDHTGAPSGRDGTAVGAEREAMVDARDAAGATPATAASRGATLDHGRPTELRHPHRHSVRVPDRPRRPGTSTAREQLCLTPVEPAIAARPAGTSAPPWRTEPQNTFVAELVRTSDGSGSPATDGGGFAL